MRVSSIAARPLFALLAAAVLVLGLACGDDDDAPATASPAPSASVTPSVSGAASATPAPGTVTAAPTFSGDVRGVLAFVSFREVNQEIFIKDLPDGDERNLTNDPAEDFDPDISEDGERILFASNRNGGTTHVWVMNADGSGVRQLTTDSQGGQTPRWSRDGTKIAYARGGDVAVMNADGTGVEVLMEFQPEDTAEPCRAGAFVGGWSPDDTLITYYSASVTREIAQVCTVDVETREVTTIVSEPDAYDVEPVISPDGSKIVYRGITGGQHDIWVVDLETGERTNLTDDAALDIEPDWSPDGEWIAFGSLRRDAENFDLYVMRPDGTEVQRVTDNVAKEANPVWAPD